MPPLVAIGLAALAAGSGFSLVRVLAAQPAPASQPQNHAELSPTEPQEAAATQPAESVEPAGQRLVSGLIGSAHDFTRLGYGRDLCLPCHTPHQAFSEPPLLDRRGVTPAASPLSGRGGGLNRLVPVVPRLSRWDYGV